MGGRQRGNIFKANWYLIFQKKDQGSPLEVQLSLYSLVSHSEFHGGGVRYHDLFMLRIPKISTSPLTAHINVPQVLLNQGLEWRQNHHKVKWSLKEKTESIYWLPEPGTILGTLHTVLLFQALNSRYWNSFYCITAQFPHLETGIILICLTDLSWNWWINIHKMPR